MDKLLPKITFATVATVVSALAGGGFYVGGLSRDVEESKREISDFRREFVESRKEMAALRSEISRLNGLLESRGLPARISLPALRARVEGIYDAEK